MSTAGTFTVILRDEGATRALGATIATELREGDVLLLVGELGAGKTTLVKGLVGALDPRIEVTSPTFALCHRYEGTRSIAHVDCWRIERTDELEELALDELLDDGWVALIEWGDRLDGRYEEIALRIELLADQAGRLAHISSTNARWNLRLGELLERHEHAGGGPC